LDSGLLDILAEKHNDWVKMAMSFGCQKDQANELVQEMYLRLYKYVDNPGKIMYNDKDVNTFYVYITLRNLFLSKKHEYTQPKHREFNKNDLPYDDPGLDLFEFEDAYHNLIEKIRAIVQGWYWYDRKLWDIHFYKDLSMRSISKETTISLSSIFNTLKNGKKEVKQKTQNEYKTYIETKEDS
jgi:DNA-directed RNA polymerase specialized sigma24 family protein